MSDTGDGSRTEPAAPGEPLAPYVIEGARSSRSKCKTCRRKIERGALRIGMLIEGPYGTGYLWHHLKCAARRHFDRVSEAYEQEAWKAAQVPPARLPDLEALRQEAEARSERSQNRRLVPYAERAPSGRARCKRCGELMDQGALRVAVGRNVQFGNQTRMGIVHVHPRCVAEELRGEDSATPAEGFAEALREHSPEIPAAELDGLLAEVGPLT